MSRGFSTAALAAALAVSSLAGCGSPASPTTGRGGYQTSGPGPGSTGKPAETVKETAKTSTGHHDPG